MKAAVSSHPPLPEEAGEILLISPTLHTSTDVWTKADLGNHSPSPSNTVTGRLDRARSSLHSQRSREAEHLRWKLWKRGGKRCTFPPFRAASTACLCYESTAEEVCNHDAMRCFHVCRGFGVSQSSTQISFSSLRRPIKHNLHLYLLSVVHLAAVLDTVTAARQQLEPVMQQRGKTAVFSFSPWRKLGFCI